jgi:streptogramin lyase
MGVFRFSYVKETFTELPLELKAPVTHLTFDRDSNLWVSTNGGGVVRYTEKNNDEPETEYYALNETGGKADFIYSDADNQQWVICRSVQPGLLRLNKSTNTFRPFERSGATPAQGATSML